MYPEELTCRLDEGLDSESRLLAALRHAASAELADAMRMVEHCVLQLDEEQVWRRPAEGLNSVGNLLLHLTGNLRQWVVCGLGGEADDRRRADEFAVRGGISRDELLSQLRDCVRNVQDVMPGVTADQLLNPGLIQGFKVSGMAALWHAVPHFRGHTQEIIGLTRQILGDRYLFAWVPQNAAQGAAGPAG